MKASTLSCPVLSIRVVNTYQRALFFLFFYQSTLLSRLKGRGGGVVLYLNVAGGNAEWWNPVREFGRRG